MKFLNVRSALRFGVLLLALPLSSCALFPEGFNEPPAQTPKITLNDWISAEHKNVLEEALNPKWWQAFNDPFLNALLDKTLNHNPDLQIGKERVVQAMAQAQRVRAAILPSVSMSSQYSRNKASLQDGSIASQFIKQGSASRINDVYGVGLDTAWELDFFGGRRQQSKGAQARVVASELQQQQLRLSIVAETVNLYITARGIQHQQKLLAQQIQLLRDQKQLVAQRLEFGLATQSELLAVDTVLRAREARRPELEGAFNQAAYGIALLAGQQPGEFLTSLRKPRPLPDINGPLPLGLKSDLLLRRPDILAAEYTLAAASHDVAAVKAAFFPSISLTANVGYSAKEAGSLIEQASQRWLLVPFVRIPFFQGGALRAQFKQTKSSERQASLQYHKTVLQALNEAESGLIAYQKERESAGQWRLANEAAKKSQKLAKDLYNQGLAGMTELLDAERNVVDAETALLDSHIKSVHNIVGLYKALGGGWEMRAKPR